MYRFQNLRRADSGNFGKCKCIHIGHGNMDEEYKMGDAVLGRTTQEMIPELRDLG